MKHCSKVENTVLKLIADKHNYTKTYNSVDNTVIKLITQYEGRRHCIKADSWEW